MPGNPLVNITSNFLKAVLAFYTYTQLNGKLITVLLLYLSSTQFATIYYSQTVQSQFMIMTVVVSLLSASLDVFLVDVTLRWSAIQKHCSLRERTL